MSLSSRWVLLVIAVVTKASPAVAGELDATVADVSDLEALYETGDLDEESFSHLVDRLEAPLDINTATTEDLAELPGLTRAQADAIVEHRERKGAFPSVDSVRNVAGIGALTVRRLRPFVRVDVWTGPVLGRARVGAAFRRGMRVPAGYLYAEATAGDETTAAVLTTARQTTRPRWDRSRGALVASVSPVSPVLEHAFVQLRRARWRAVVGDFAIGFATRVTLDTTGRHRPHGWVARASPRVSRRAGRIRPQRTLRGGATTVEFPVAGGSVDLTAFGSHRPVDVYQYDLWYGPDPAYAHPGTCQRDSDCPYGYTCRPTRRCYASAVFDQGAPEASLRHLTLRGAADETVGGFGLHWRNSEGEGLGIHGYLGRAVIRMARSTHPRFALSARYPSVGNGFGAVGAGGVLALGPLRLSGEVSMTTVGSPAAVGDARWSLVPGTEVVTTVYGYGRDFDNPLGRSMSSTVEELGSRRRNQRGVRVHVRSEISEVIQSTTQLDVTRIPSRPTFDEQGRLRWVEGDGAIASQLDERWVGSRGPRMLMGIRQHFDVAATANEDMSLVLTHRDNDLFEGGRDESYANGTRDRDYWRAVGRGERRSVAMDLESHRLPRVDLRVGASAAWVDRAPRCPEGSRWAIPGRSCASVDGAMRRPEYLTHFAREASLRAVLHARPSDGVRVRLSARWWPQPPVSDGGRVGEVASGVVVDVDPWRMAVDGGADVCKRDGERRWEVWGAVEVGVGF